MHELVERLMVLAAPKRKATRKYVKEVENLFDELLAHFTENSDYTKKDRAFRLMMRIRKALEAEGYAFREKVMPAGPSLNSTTPPSRPVGKLKHFASNGHVCTLLKSKPPQGLDKDATLKLVGYLGSKQGYQFVVKPSDLELLRKSGINASLPKPLTWAKLENYGLTRENIVTDDGRALMEEFTIDGITAFTIDRQTFYTSNPGMCRRWMHGLDRIADQAINR